MDVRNNDEGFRQRDFSRTKMLQPRRKVELKRTCDALWQLHPKRVLKYKPLNLHYYGWIPFLNYRNIKATVFSEVYLYIQTLILIGYTLVLHLTGFGASLEDIGYFIKMFGTSYVGSLFNFAMLITFILGLFVTLVINRWWEIRTTYSKFKGVTMDLIMSIVQSIDAEDRTSKTNILRAKIELARFINLGHILLLMKADSLNDSFKRPNGLKTLVKLLCRKVKKYFNKGCLSREPTNINETSSYGTDDFWTRKKLRDVNLTDLVNEGLVNDDEWEIITANEKAGLSSYQTVYYWAQLMIHKCKKAGWITNENTAYPAIIVRLQTVTETGSSIINNINSQMPYPYVHLVSFVVHVYLFVLATWFGCFLYSGYPEEQRFIVSGQLDCILDKKKLNLNDKNWTVTWVYIFIVIANITFQGLLDIHSLLDNPFGTPCTKFAVKANMYDVLHLTRSMLTKTKGIPAAFGDIFSSELGNMTNTAFYSHRRQGNNEQHDTLRNKYTSPIEASDKLIDAKHNNFASPNKNQPDHGFPTSSRTHPYFGKH